MRVKMGSGPNTLASRLGSGFSIKNPPWVKSGSGQSNFEVGQGRPNLPYAIPNTKRKWS